MNNQKLADSDYRFMEVIWDHEPVGSMELVKLCEKKLGWKKSTTFTMLRKLSEKQLVENVNSTVRSLVTREKIEASHSDYVVNNTFHGSLPRFITAFLGNKTLSREEADELRRLIDEHQED